MIKRTQEQKESPFNRLFWLTLIFWAVGVWSQEIKPNPDLEAAKTLLKQIERSGI